MKTTHVAILMLAVFLMLASGALAVCARGWYRAEKELAVANQMNRELVVMVEDMTNAHPELSGKK